MENKKKDKVMINVRKGIKKKRKERRRTIPNTNIKRKLLNL